MKKLLYTLIVAMLAFGSMAFTTNKASAQGLCEYNEGDVVVTITTQGLRIRQTPSFGGTRLALIPYNTEFTVTDTQMAEGVCWLKNTYDPSNGPAVTGWSASEDTGGNAMVELVEAAPETSNDGEGVSQEELDAVYDAMPTTGRLIRRLDALFNAEWWAMGGAWNDEDAESTFSITGPAWFWTDLGEDFRVPSNGSLRRVRTTGNWGVWEVPAGKTFTVPSDNAGGRYVNIATSEAADNDMPEYVSDFLAVIPTDSIDDAIAWLDDDDNHNASSRYFDEDEAQTVPANAYAVIWTNWGSVEAIPACVSPVTGLVDGGRGVWLAKGQCTFTNAANGGGMTIIEDPNEEGQG
jgi:hypothetical protein